MVRQFFNLEGKNALVVGMGNNIARDVCLALAESGANMALSCSSPNASEIKTLLETCELIGSQGRIILPVTDSSDSEEKVSEIIDKILQQFNRIDIFINNLDLPFAKPFIDNSLQEWSRVIEVNLNQFFLWTRILGKIMIRQNKGRIISITSHLGQRGLNNCVAYCAAKGGVIQMTRALALEWAKNGITVNAIALGWIENTHLTSGIDASLLPALERYLPIRKIGKTDEVGGMVIYLSSDEAEFISGQIFNVDGGVACHP